MGSMSACAVTENPSTYPYERGKSGKPDWKAAPADFVGIDLRGVGCAWTSKQPSNRLPAVARSTTKLVDQFVGRPGRLTAHVPLGERRQRLVVSESESSNEPAADAKRVKVAVLAGNRRRH